MKSGSELESYFEFKIKFDDALFSGEAVAYDCDDFFDFIVIFREEISDIFSEFSALVFRDDKTALAFVPHISFFAAAGE